MHDFTDPLTRYLLLLLFKVRSTSKLNTLAVKYIKSTPDCIVITHLLHTARELNDVENFNFCFERTQHFFTSVLLNVMEKNEFDF